MSPDELFTAVQQAAGQVRAEMEQQPQPSPVLALLEESFALRAVEQARSQQRGSALLQIAAQMTDSREQPAEAGQEVPVIPGRPHGGIIEHPPVPPEETAQGKAEAEQAAREAEEAARDAEARRAEQAAREAEAAQSASQEAEQAAQGETRPSKKAKG